MPVLPENDALALEYKLMNLRPTRDLNVTDFVNNPLAAGEVRVSSLRLKEELAHLTVRELRALGDDGADLPLVCFD